ncbi:right-handed parallel beta-helix repeat-containing protein [Paenibacillus pasadenensis]|uniref:right-handed parallel beta-helix repeat-containing protein n=1 Tax=Paenibacillus pasadenensis TaxID=217090 RepID=UPI00203E4D45|nr:right-handed parallel beta-helix repeat-containing protein [Paenibacillus pasadenensis]
MSIVNIQDFGVGPDQEKDATVAVFRAIESCRELDRATLLFPKGRYHFWPDKAVEKQYFIPNHDQDKNRRIAFPLFEMKGLTIDGQGSEFIFHGLTVPFVLDGCDDITVKNASIDWERPILSQGKVIAVGDGTFDVEIPKEYPYEVVENSLIFLGEGWTEPCKGIIEMDSQTKGPAYGSGDYLNYGSYLKFKVEELAPGLLRYHGAGEQPKIGNELIFQCGYRDCPGVFINNSTEVELASINMYHTIGMGVIAQRSENIKLNAFNVMIKPGSGRLFSTAADATHFVYCRGSILLEGCLFENQMDDPCNVHGIYSPITELVDEHTIMVQLVHSQQRGAVVALPGETVRFLNRVSLLPFELAVVKEVKTLNPEYSLVTFTQKLPASVGAEDLIENISWKADLTIRKSVVRGNRARGFLITTAGKVLVEQNVISTPGAGIKISGDGNYWYESGAVQDITIRNNTFQDCNYCYPQWGHAAIDIDPEIDPNNPHEDCYHANIRIEGNRFVTFHPTLVNANSVDGIVFSGNTVERSERYPATSSLMNALSFRNCKNIIIENNEFLPDQLQGTIGTETIDLSNNYASLSLDELWKEKGLAF